MPLESLFRTARLVACMIGFCGALTAVLHADDWTRFRGPNGTGISQATGVPVKWNDTLNLKWKAQLPGPGFSSPIVVSDRVFVTCYSGYGEDPENPGQIDDLKRHLVCMNRSHGESIWTVDIHVVQPEDPYKGFITEHGYASHTPVSDGEHIYVFWGKSGVFAFDLDGCQLWQTSVGTGSGPMKWGSAASPILAGDLLIVNAVDESGAVVALDKETGKEVWRESTKSLSQNWTTPVLMESQGGPVLVMVALGEILGRDPATGQLTWTVEGFESRGYSASLASGDGIVYGSGGMLGGSSFALSIADAPAGGASAYLWTGRNLESIISPLVHDGHVYGATGRGIAYCLDAQSGKPVYQVRLASREAAEDQVPAAAGGGRSGGRPRGEVRGGRRGPGGGDYASPVYAEGKLFLTTRSGVIYVLAAGPEFKILAENRFASDQSDFCATPAILNDGIFIRSNKYLYCVSE